MATIGSRIDQDIDRACLQAAFEYRLKSLVLRLPLFERKVVNENNKIFQAGSEDLHNLRKITQIVPRNLQYPERVMHKMMKQGFDGGRFSGSPVAIDKDVVGRKTCKKMSRVAHQPIFLIVAANKIFQPDRIGRSYAL